MQLLRSKTENHDMAELTVFTACGVPIIRGGSTVSLSLHSEVLIFKKRYRITQLEAVAKRRHQRFSGKIQLLMDIMGAICFQESKLETSDPAMYTLVRLVILTWTLLAVLCDGASQLTTYEGIGQSLWGDIDSPNTSPCGLDSRGHHGQSSYLC